MYVISMRISLWGWIFFIQKPEIRAWLILLMLSILTSSCLVFCCFYLVSGWFLGSREFFNVKKFFLKGHRSVLNVDCEFGLSIIQAREYFTLMIIFLLKLNLISHLTMQCSLPTFLLLLRAITFFLLPSISEATVNLLLLQREISTSIYGTPFCQRIYP